MTLVIAMLAMSGDMPSAGGILRACRRRDGTTGRARGCWEPAGPTRWLARTRRSPSRPWPRAIGDIPEQVHVKPGADFFAGFSRGLGEIISNVSSSSAWRAGTGGLATGTMPRQSHRPGPAFRVPRGQRFRTPAEGPASGAGRWRRPLGPASGGAASGPARRQRC